MKQSEWAENECQKICKQINPNFEFGKEQFDYSCSCYESALKAYKSLCEDGHSGYSFNITKHILIRLMEGLPLSPITEEDFPNDITGFDSSDGSVTYQCPRMSSLFKDVYKDGTIQYRDVNRCYCINIECPSDTYSTWTPIDELFPIKLPYSPFKEKYKIYTQTFLFDKNNGDYDTKAYLYVITPDGTKIDLNIYRAEKNGKWCNITLEEYNERLEKRIDKLNYKITNHLLFTLLDNSCSEEESEKRNKKYDNLSIEEKEGIETKLHILCECFNNPDYWKYNTFELYHNLCTKKESDKNYPKEIEDIRTYLHEILNIIKY